MDNNQMQNQQQVPVDDNTVVSQQTQVVNDQDTPVTLNQENEMDNSVQSTPVVEEEVQEKKASPLEALASKLAELKSELIQEVPENSSTENRDENATQPIDQVSGITSELPHSPAPEISSIDDQSTAAQISSDYSNLANQSITQEQTLPDMTSNDNVQPDQTTPTPDVNAQENTEQVVINTNEQDDISNLQQMIDQQVTNELEKEVVNTQPVLDTPMISEQTTSEQLVTQNVEGNAVEQLQSTQLVENTQEPTTLDSPSLDNQVLESQEVVNAPQTQKEVEAPSVDDILSQYEVTSTQDLPQDENSAEVISNSTDIQEDETATASTKQDYALDIRKVFDIAIERNASDILVSVGYPVMIRVDGSLVAVHEQIVSPKNAEELIFPVLSEQKKELLEVNREVDLAYTHQHNGEARFRINAFYTRENLAGAFRLIPTKIKTIEELNLPPIYNQLANLKQGLVLVTGPTGHGKSTTLAAILQAVNTNRSVHILTIEDPIEYIFPKAKAVVDQREMHDDTHSWTVALKSAMRQNPDVILVGEMRDFETISAAITLAETGHLVFATLHTNSATQTIDRIIDVFPENQQAQIRTQLATILEAVIAQRLIPIDGGGRRAVSEIMIGTPAIRNLIREGKSHQMDNVIRTSSDVGMVSLESSLVKLVREGLITMDKAQEYAVHPEEVVRLLKG